MIYISASSMLEITIVWVYPIYRHTEAKFHVALTRSLPLTGG
jgi:hypothetical protein